MTPAFDIRAQHAAELRILGRLHPRQDLASFARWVVAHPHVFGSGLATETESSARAVLADIGEPAPAPKPEQWDRVRSLWEMGA